MTEKSYFAIFAVLSLLFGIGFVLAPAQVLHNYGIQSAPNIEFVGRLFGGTLLAIAVIEWSARQFPEAAVRPILIALCITGVVNFVVSVMATLAGIMNALGWSAVLIYFCLAAGAAYLLRIRQPRGQIDPTVA